MDTQSARDNGWLHLRNFQPKEMREALAYAGLVLIAFELVKSMIVHPIKSFYHNVTFGEGMMFESYDEDVRSRHGNEFEACLLYLRDFMEAISSQDMRIIQMLRERGNELAHNLVLRLPDLRRVDHQALLEDVDHVFCKLSNYRTRMEIGADPNLQGLGIDWESVKAHEYLLFESVVERVRFLGAVSPPGP